MRNRVWVSTSSDYNFPIKFDIVQQLTSHFKSILERLGHTNVKVAVRHVQEPNLPLVLDGMIEEEKKWLH